jgi:serine/threonine-protein phosphatase 2A regulatory subunit B
VFEEEEDPAQKSVVSEIIASISDVKFTSDGRYIVSRDYLTVKIWDMNMEAKPVKTIQIHEHLRSKLCDLYENDCIFDKFECTVSGDGNNLVTGSYNNFFHIYDRYGQSDIAIEAAKNVPKRRASNAKGGFKMGRKKTAGGKDEINVDQIDFGKKVLHLAWHPQQPIIAVAGLNNLYIYSQV